MTGQTSSQESMMAAIEAAIIDGTWAPGDKLPSERALTDEYGLSRPLVREALRRLEERGYIQVLPARGSFVRGPTASDASRPLHSLFQRSGVTARHLVIARIMLECEAAELASASADTEAKERIRQILTAHDSAADITERADLDVAFHEAIIRASGNPVLRIMFGSIRPLVRGLIIRSLTDRAVRRAGEPLHATIVDAISAGDGRAARAAMHEHLSLALQYYGDDLDQPLSTVLRRRATVQEDTFDLAAVLSELDSLS
jgi:GntR family transcriptional regulator, transcriptional repressor for pyruvate dehydrogenase complex